MAVNNHTGEVVETVTFALPSGSIAYTPQQQEEYKKRKLLEQEKVIRRQIKNELGNFYFAYSEKRYSDISPQTMVRLVYIATYLRYVTNQLFLSERTPLNKAGLFEIMNLSRKTFYRFWDEVKDVYLFEDENGVLSLSDDFYRGDLAGYFYQNDGKKSFQQLYIEALRKLYLETPAIKHGYLGYVFQMLPYINWEYNILCWNPDETDIEKIALMTLDEWCGLIGYDKSQRSRLMKTYAQLIFKWKDKRQRFCSFVSGDYKNGNIRIFINPHILYRGSNWCKVEILGAFFQDGKTEVP